MRRAAFAVPVLAAAALVAGCGTTVPVSQQAATQLDSGGLGPLEPGSTGQAGGTTGAATPGTALGGTSGGTVSRPGGGATGGTVAHGTSGSTGVLPPSSGTVEVGFWVIKDLGPATKALGVDGLATGDAARQVAASVSLLNARGGLNGRRVKPVVFQQDATRDSETQYQEACGLFFDDHKVVAVVAALLNPTIQSCSTRHGVPLVTSGNRTTSAAEIARYPALAVPSQLGLAGVVRTLIPSLQAQQWFRPRSATETVRVGLLYNEDPDYAEVPGLVEQELKHIGIALTDKQSMPGTDDTSRVAGASSAGSNAVLRFSAARITHVLVVDKSGQAVAYFGLAAANQGYYPSYGLSSLSLPASLRTVLSKRQLTGARGIGWLPSWDTPTSRQPALSPNATACVSAMKKQAQDMDLAATRGSALATCDSTLLLGAAFKGREISAQGFLGGLRGLGAKWPAVMTLSTNFANHRTGAATVRPLAFDTGCDCFLYAGPATGAAQ